ncbi:MAG: nucleoside deaminase, partial [Bacilli bacterium]|nr:nucleoside deaminase [Bacilli bacterium]
LEEAKAAYAENEVPVGAILVMNGEVIGRGHNHREKQLEIHSHAEIEAIEEGAKRIGRWNLDGATLYVTLEPCLMCAGAIIQSKISRLVYGADDDERGAVVSRLSAFEYFKGDANPLIYKGILKDECKELLSEFFASQRKEKIIFKKD